MEQLAEPILKWAGGKRQLLRTLLPLVPNYSGKYIEPFVGGGAMFFALSPQRAILSDCNEELILLYQTIAANPDAVIEELKQYNNTEEDYYRVRSLDWKSLSPVEASARMIFLNKTGYNGLYRVNRKGAFNVPYGKNQRTNICNDDQIRRAASALKNTEIICADYREVYSAHKDMGGGVSIDLIHEWDYISYLIGYPHSVQSIITRKSNLEIDSDDIAVYIAEYKDKVVEVHLDYFGRKTQRKIELYTSEDTIVVDLIDQKINWLCSGKVVDLSEDRDSYQIRELQHFLDIAKGKIESDNTIKEACRVLRMARGVK